MAKVTVGFSLTITGLLKFRLFAFNIIKTDKNKIIIEISTKPEITKTDLLVFDISIIYDTTTKLCYLKAKK